MKLSLLLKQCRPHQWSKNVLLFLPILAAHEWHDAQAWLSSLVAFVCFSFLASSIYVLNDIFDREHDRKNPHKKHRPIASGAISLGTAIALGLVLFGGAFASAWIFLGQKFTLACGLYALINIAYSMKLKRHHSMDVICLASLYTLRILAGGAATQIPISFWLLAFSIFFFLALALIKRVSELKRNTREALSGRDYTHDDIPVLNGLGNASSFASILVLALYLQNPDVSKLYAHPSYLLALLPLSIFWLTRLWILCNRGQVHDDPVIFALKDSVTWMVSVLGILCLYIAT